MLVDIRPGDVPSRVHTTVVVACVATVLLAFIGMQAMWEHVEWAEEPYFYDSMRFGRSAFWYTNGLGLAICAAIAIAWLPRFHIAKSLRVAVALPLVHLAAIATAAGCWSVLDADARFKLATADLREYFTHESPPLPSISLLAAAFVVVVAVAILIKRRHGEWAHAMVMLALAFLLLLGVWLPVVSRMAVEVRGYWHGGDHRVMGPTTVAWLAVVPPALGSLALTLVMFRFRRVLDRRRHLLRLAAITLTVIAMVFALALPDKGWLVYLESSYLVMSAVLIAVTSLVLLAIVAWSRSLLAQRRARAATHVSGVISRDDDHPVALYEVASTLRGPLLVSRPFVVTTKHGDLAISGARLLVPLPTSSTTLEVGEHVAVLGPGDQVDIALRATSADGHPFRAMDVADILTVASHDARTYRFSDIVLVVWRPALAYLAILVAVAAPYLTIFLSD